MANPEITFQETFRQTCKPDVVDEYSRASEIIQEAIQTVVSPRLGEEFAFTQLFVLDPLRPERVCARLDPERPAVKAAMLIGAISLRAYLYKSLTSGFNNISFRQMWVKTPLWRLAGQCEDIVDELTPKTTGAIVTIDTKAMQDKFINDIHAHAPEHIVLTGLNGVGKSAAGKILTEFLDFCDVRSKLIKMPRPDGPISKLILPILDGSVEYNSNARQLLFLSDAMDIKPEPDALIIYDRHARTEALVYGTEAIERVVLATHEIFDDVFHTFVLDRHPLRNMSLLEKRDRQPRIFERNVDIMIEQLSRLAKLTTLPGVHWINTDSSKDRSEKPYFKLATTRVLGAVVASGVIQRHMVKQNLAENFPHAEVILNNNYWDFKSKKRIEL